MKGRSFLIRISAFFLLLVFSQKSWGGLFIHDILHLKEADAPLSPEDQKKDIGYHCSCIDDFLAPYSGSDGIVFDFTPSIFFNPVVCLTVDVIEQSALQSSLRGPPCC
jgi:hypothetical protein